MGSEMCIRDRYGDAQEKSETFFAAIDCDIERRFVPTKIQCTNTSPTYDQATWKVNGIIQESGLDGHLKYNADTSGEYNVELLLINSSFFSDSEAIANEVLILGERKAFERDVSQNFRINSTHTRVKKYSLGPPEGFRIDTDSVKVQYQNHRGKARIVDQKIEHNEVVVSIRTEPQIKVSGIHIRKDVVQGTLLIAFKANKENE